MAEADSPILRVPFEVTDPERIPTPRYHDEDFYRLENEKLWPHVWQMAARTEQLQNVGDYIVYENLGKTVIVVRGKEGIKAFHNACRHRGVELASGHGNCKTQGFICPFHGWRWNTEGKNTFVYGKHMFSEQQLDQADLALRPCRTEEWNGCVWINYDDDAPSLAQTMGPLYENLTLYGADRMRAEWWYYTELPANWKIAMEAFMEGYHVMRTHPQLQQKAPMIYNSMYGYDTGGIGVPIDPNLTMAQNIAAQIDHMQLLSDGMAGMCHAKDVESARKLTDVELPEDPQQALMHWFGMVNHMVTTDGQARGEGTPDLNALAMTNRVNAVEYMFPHYFVLPFLSSMAAYRIKPLGPEKCSFELWSLTLFPEGEEPAPVMEPTILPYDSQEFPEIPRQDYSNIPRQQIGLHAEGFDFMRLSKDIEGLISNYNRILDGYLRGDDQKKLATATGMLSGNFDGPIKDLGL